MTSWKALMGLMGLGLACAACCTLPLLGGGALLAGGSALLAGEALLAAAALAVLAALFAAMAWRRRRAARQRTGCTGACQVDCS